MAANFLRTISIMPANKRKQEILGTGLGIFLLLALILVLRAAKGGLVIFPEPAEVLRTFFRILGEGKTYRLIGTTVANVLISLAAAVLIGGTLGFLEGVYPFFKALMKPVMSLLRTMPMIVLIILIMVLFPDRKYRYVPVISVSLVLIPIISEAFCEGCLSIDQEYLDVYRLNSRFNLNVLTHVHLPLISGYVRQAFINAAGMGFKIAITAEYLVQTAHSLGKEIYMSTYFNEYEEIYAYALLVVILVMLISWIPSIPGIAGARKNRKGIS